MRVSNQIGGLKVDKFRKWPKIVSYTKELSITNIDQLVNGTGCKYLEAMPAHNGDLVAIQWRRKMVDSIPTDHILIKF